MRRHGAWRGANAMAPDLERRTRQYLIFRLLLVLLGFGLVTFYQLRLESAFAEKGFIYLYGLLWGYLGLALALLASYSRWKGRPRWMRYQVVGDFILQSLLVWGTGGVVSLFSPILFVTLVAATSVTSPRWTFFLAAGAATILAGTTVACSLGFAPVSLGDDSWNLLGDRSIFVAAYLVGSVLALFAVSALGSRFSHGLRSITGMHSEILENIAEGLVAVDREGRVVELNREARSLLGLENPHRQLRGVPIEALFPSEQHAPVRDAFRQARRRRLETTIRAPWSPEGEAKAGPARDRPVEVKISSVLDDDGKQRFRIGLLSDLSLQREMAAAALRIQKLEDLQVMSLGIAHEIRNPLASIRGCVQEMGRFAQHDSQFERLMAIVLKESDRLDKILEEFLLFARPGPIDLVPLDVVELVEEAALLIRSRSEFGGRALEIVVPNERPRVFGDRSRLLQALLNLALNGVQATSSQGGAIRITLRLKHFATLEAGACGKDLVPGIELEVSDNGKGMTSQELVRIFTPFFTTKTTGTGLGLSIVSRIVREHMGVLDVSSTEGLGAAFRIWLPILRGHAPSAALSPVRSPGEDSGVEEAASAVVLHA
jgi:PAS domain S-box-containing protein